MKLLLGLTVLPKGGMTGRSFHIYCTMRISDEEAKTLTAKRIRIEDSVLKEGSFR